MKTIINSYFKIIAKYIKYIETRSSSDLYVQPTKPFKHNIGTLILKRVQFTRSFATRFKCKPSLNMVLTRLSEIYNSTIGGGQSSRTPSVDKEPTDCLECRLVGGAGLSAVGLYLWYLTRTYRLDQVKLNQPISRSKVTAGWTLGLAFIGLGAFRFSGNTLPFVSSVQNEPNTR